VGLFGDSTSHPSREEYKDDETPIVNGTAHAANRWVFIMSPERQKNPFAGKAGTIHCGCSGSKILSKSEQNVGVMPLEIGRFRAANFICAVGGVFDYSNEWRLV
jgi:hypothetical protein